MAQKPATPAPRKAQPAKKPAVKAPAAKPVKKATGPQAAPSGGLEGLVNQHLVALRTAEQALAEAKALIQTYRDRYPELAAYLPASAVEERAIHLREDAADESRGSHRFRIRIQGRGPRYEMRDAEEEDYRPVVLSRKLFANVSSLFANGDRQSAMPLLDARKLQTAAKEEITKVPKRCGSPLPDQVRSRNFVAAVAAGNFDAQG